MSLLTVDIKVGISWDNNWTSTDMLEYNLRHFSTMYNVIPDVYLNVVISEFSMQQFHSEALRSHVIS